MLRTDRTARAAADAEVSPPAAQASSPEMAAHLARLQAAFQADLELRLRRLGALLGGDRPEMADLLEAHRIAHNIAGAGGVFGQPEVSMRARELEEAISAVLDRDEAPEAGCPDAIPPLLEALERSATSLRD